MTTSPTDTDATVFRAIGDRALEREREDVPYSDLVECLGSQGIEAETIYSSIEYLGEHGIIETHGREDWGYCTLTPVGMQTYLEERFDDLATIKQKIAC